jgi:hypothetical protein
MILPSSWSEPLHVPVKGVSTGASVACGAGLAEKGRSGVGGRALTVGSVEEAEGNPHARMEEKRTRMERMDLGFISIPIFELRLSRFATQGWLITK